MKVTIDFSDFQVLKVLALSSANEKQSEALFAAVHEIPELDITELCRTNKHFIDLSQAVCACALAVIAENHKINSPYVPLCQSV